MKNFDSDDESDLFQGFLKKPGGVPFEAWASTLRSKLTPPRQKTPDQSLRSELQTVDDSKAREEIKSKSSPRAQYERSERKFESGDTRSRHKMRSVPSSPEVPTDPMVISSQEMSDSPNMITPKRLQTDDSDRESRDSRHSPERYDNRRDLSLNDQKEINKSCLSHSKFETYVPQPNQHVKDQSPREELMWSQSSPVMFESPEPRSTTDRRHSSRKKSHTPNAKRAENLKGKENEFGRNRKDWRKNERSVSPSRPRSSNYNRSLRVRSPSRGPRSDESKNSMNYRQTEKKHAFRRTSVDDRGRSIIRRRTRKDMRRERYRKRSVSPSRPRSFDYKRPLRVQSPSRGSRSLDSKNSMNYRQTEKKHESRSKSSRSRYKRSEGKFERGDTRSRHKMRSVPSSPEVPTDPMLISSQEMSDSPNMITPKRLQTDDSDRESRDSRHSPERYDWHDFNYPEEKRVNTGAFLYSQLEHYVEHPDKDTYIYSTNRDIMPSHDSREIRQRVYTIASPRASVDRGTSGSQDKGVRAKSSNTKERGKTGQRSSHGDRRRSNRRSRSSDKNRKEHNRKPMRKGERKSEERSRCSVYMKWRLIPITLGKITTCYLQRSKVDLLVNPRDPRLNQERWLYEGLYDEDRTFMP